MGKKKQLSMTIPALETFKQSLEQRCCDIIMENDSSYPNKIYAKYNECLSMNLSYSESLEKCFPLLERKYSKLATLLGSLHEVRYAWKRLTLLFALLEVNPPETQNYNIDQSQWFKFCQDSMWYADFGLFEKLISFIKKLQRSLSIKKNSIEMQKFNEHLVYVNKCRNEIKKGRDPLAHTQAITLNEIQYEKFWQILLVVRYNSDSRMDLSQIFDYYININTRIEQLYEWVESSYKVLTSAFSYLNSLSLSRLIIKETPS